MNLVHTRHPVVVLPIADQPPLALQAARDTLTDTLPSAGVDVTKLRQVPGSYEYRRVF
jgi:hypothetical protein